MNRARYAFTLIEVMVSVMIISVVIMALLEMQGNNTHMFLKLKSNLKLNQFESYFIQNKDYGFEKKSVYLDDLLSEFKIEDNLRIKLKEIRLHIDYNELDRYGDSNSSEGADSDGMVLEIGKSTIKTKVSTISFVRLKLQ